MANNSSSKPSFTPYRKWGIGLNVVLVLAVVFGVVVMVNYLARDYFFRAHLSSMTQHTLSPRTQSLLRSITNHVKVVIYYDKNEPLYSTVAELINEYKLSNPRITVQAVDFLRDAAAAQKVRSDYNLASPSDKNLVIFDCEGRSRVVDGNLLAQYTLEELPNTTEREFRRKPVTFLGESMFTAAFLHVTQPQPLKACFLEGHGEHQIDSADALTGYLKFLGVLQQNYIEAHPISILGTNEIPADCSLLIIAGPRAPLLEQEIQKIDRFLNEGKRLLALFNADTAGKLTGLESVLAKWGISVGPDTIVDPEHTSSGTDVIVSGFSRHQLVNPLLNSGLYLIRPRLISRLESSTPFADVPKAEEVAFTGSKSWLSRSPAAPRTNYPVMVALERGGNRGVITDQQSTRIVVVGDSYFLANNQLELLANRDFANSVVNWLLERSQMLEGVGPRPVTEYRLIMSASELRASRWILLAGMPGAVLLIGVLVQWRRSK
jgi:ABC-type uncharacterized transport system involved in gliding motility auxiliary subunit